MTKRMLILAPIAAVLAAAPAQASCVQSSERQDVRNADAVFVGRVLSVRQDDGAAVFRIGRVLKGGLKRGALTRVYPDGWPNSSLSIGWRPEPGQRWRLYVDRRDGRWRTHDCMGTRRA